MRPRNDLSNHILSLARVLQLEAVEKRLYN
jgi:hypothetical protein